MQDKRKGVKRLGETNSKRRNRLRAQQASKKRGQNWKPGWPLSEEERTLLKPLIARARELGRTPTVKEVAEASRIKAHFRIWRVAVEAASLPSLNDPEQVHLRSLEGEKMKCNQALAFAQEEGFEAAIIGTGKIVFDESFRKYCEENLCGQYQVNYSCPPTCGSPDEMWKKALGFGKALVVKSGWDVPDWHNAAAIRRAKKTHNEAMLRILSRMEEAGYQGLMCGASCCSLCEQCAMSAGEPCRFPDRKFSCLSAYCINVSKLAEACGMEYSWEEGKLGLYGMILFGSQNRKK